MTETECQLTRIECQLTTSECQLTKPECQLTATECRLTTTECRLTKTECSLSAKCDGAAQNSKSDDVPAYTYLLHGRNYSKARTEPYVYVKAYRYLRGRMKPRIRVLYCTPPTVLGTTWHAHTALSQVPLWAGLLLSALADRDLASKPAGDEENRLIGGNLVPNCALPEKVGCPAK